MSDVDNIVPSTGENLHVFKGPDVLQQQQIFHSPVCVDTVDGGIMPFL